MPGLSLVSVNIERSKHLDRVLPFLKERKADVVCLQELMERDIPLFAQELGAKWLYSGNTTHMAEGSPGIMDVAIFTALPTVANRNEYYWGDSDMSTRLDMQSVQAKHDSESHAVLSADIKKGGEIYRIATNHFTWTPNGDPDDFQREDLERMFGVFDRMKEFVLCGDFNAPRGGEIFSKLAARYRDNIPEKYDWSLDLNLHRSAEGLQKNAARLGFKGLMVDGLFSTPVYAASDVVLHPGISDHMAVTATIAKRV